MRIHLRSRGRDAATFEVAGLARLAEGFSGAELEQAILEGMYTAFPAGREFTTQDVAAAIQATVPLSRTMADKIAALRAWARPRARWATTPTP